MKMKSLSLKKGKCPSGYIIRRGYTRKNKKNGKKTKVAARCIKNLGMGPGKRKDWIDKLEKQKKQNILELKRKGYYNDITKCTEDEILREGYIMRRKKTKKKIYVGPKCIKDRCNPGKYSEQKETNGIGPLKKGILSQFGYSDVKNKDIKKRRKSLKMAINKYSPLIIFRKLNALAIYNKNNKSVAKIFKEDKEWVREYF